MIRKRSGFWTMVWALIPGAGHMFCGFMKRGVSLMGMFAVVWALAFWLDLVVLVVITPVIWFYAFFDCLNRRFQDDERFYAQQDCYLITPDMLSCLKTFGGGKTRIVMGGALLALGIYVVWNNFIIDWIAIALPQSVRNYVYHISYSIPQIIMAALIIWLGIVLIRDKSKQVEGEQEEGLN